MRHFCQFLLFWSPNKVFINDLELPRDHLLSDLPLEGVATPRISNGKHFPSDLALETFAISEYKMGETLTWLLRPLEANEQGLQGSQHSVLCQSTSRTTPICIMSCLTSSRKYMHYCASTLTHLKEKIYLLL